MAIVCLREKNIPVEDLQRRCRGHEDGQVNLAEGKLSAGKNRPCSCTTVVFPSQEATVTRSEVAVSAAALNAISDPFIGPAKDFSVLAQVQPGVLMVPPGDGSAKLVVRSLVPSRSCRSGCGGDRCRRRVVVEHNGPGPVSRQPLAEFRNVHFELKVIRCLVPTFDGACLSSDSKDALWARFYMGAPERLRRSSSDTA